MIPEERVTIALGYDPGGDGRHGVAALWPAHDACVGGGEVATVATGEQAVTWLVARLPTGRARTAIGIDTLTTWSTGSAGWRPADRWLRETYRTVQRSIAAPNSLHGSMAIGGISVLLRLREHVPRIVVSETHPKVLYFALTGERYAFDPEPDSRMNTALRAWIGIAEIPIHDDHQWDALASAWAVREGVEGRWQRDLHTLPACEGEQLVRPAGPSHFFWPTGARA